MMHFKIIFVFLFWSCPFVTHGAPTQGPKGVCLCANHLQLMLSLHEINQLQAVCTGSTCPPGGGHLKDDELDKEFVKYVNEVSNHKYGGLSEKSKRTKVGVHTSGARLFGTTPADGSSDSQLMTDYVTASESLTSAEVSRDDTKSTVMDLPARSDRPVTMTTGSTATGHLSVNRTTDFAVLTRDEQTTTNVMTNTRNGIMTLVTAISRGKADHQSTTDTTTDGREVPDTVTQPDTTAKVSTNTLQDLITETTIEDPQITTNKRSNQVNDAKITTNAPAAREDDPQTTPNRSDPSSKSTNDIITKPNTSSKWTGDPQTSVSSPVNWPGNSQTTASLTTDMIEEIISRIPAVHLETHPHDPSQDLQQRSLCPWTYVANVDPDRYPETLMEAECLSEDCRCGLDRSSGVGCERIYRAIAVLRRVKREDCGKKDSFAFERREERLAMGCTCSLFPTE